MTDKWTIISYNGNVCSSYIKKGVLFLTRISEADRDIFEQALYLPMILTILQRDRMIIEKSPLKLKRPYIQLIDKITEFVQQELAEIKRYMKKKQMKIQRVKSDDTFTMYVFFYKGYEEKHNYFNPRLRNRTEELLTFYLFERYTDQAIHPLQQHE